MKSINKNIIAIIGLIIIAFVTISTIPFFITKFNVGYSLALLLSEILDIRKYYFIYLILQLIIVMLILILVGKRFSKIISILSFIVSFILINIIVFIHIGLSAKSGIGIWLLLLGFLLIGLNYFIGNIKGDKKMLDKKKENSKPSMKLETNVNALKNVFSNKQNIIIAVCITITCFSLIFAFSQNNSNQNGNNNNNDNVNNITDEEKNIKTVMLSEQFTINDVATITFNSVTVVDEIKPPKTNSVYSYYEDKVGEKYILLKGTYKNLLATTFDEYDNFNGKLLLNNKYEYTSVVIDFVNEDSDDFFTEPTSLQTMTAYIWVSVPDDTITSDNNFSFYLDFIGGNTANETIKLEFKK